MNLGDNFTIEKSLWCHYGVVRSVHVEVRNRKSIVFTVRKI